MSNQQKDWQARCLELGFAYVRESDDHYVLADVPEMARLLGELLGVEVRDRENESYGDTVSELQEQVDAGINAFHQAYEAGKERDQLKAENEALRKDAERYRWIEKQPTSWFALGEAFDLPSEHDGVPGLDASIDAAMAKEAK